VAWVAPPPPSFYPYGPAPWNSSHSSQAMSYAPPPTSTRTRAVPPPPPPPPPTYPAAPPADMTPRHGAVVIPPTAPGVVFGQQQPPRPPKKTIEPINNDDDVIARKGTAWLFQCYRVTPFGLRCLYCSSKVPIDKVQPIRVHANTHAEHRSVHRGRYAGWDDVQPFLEEARALFTLHALAHGMKDFLHEAVPRYLCSCDVSFDDESKLKQHVKYYSSSSSAATASSAHAAEGLAEVFPTKCGRYVPRRVVERVRQELCQEEDDRRQQIERRWKDFARTECFIASILNTAEKRDNDGNDPTMYPLLIHNWAAGIENTDDLHPRLASLVEMVSRPVDRNKEHVLHRLVQSITTWSDSISGSLRQLPESLLARINQRNPAAGKNAEATEPFSCPQNAAAVFRQPVETFLRFACRHPTTAELFEPAKGQVDNSRKEYHVDRFITQLLVAALLEKPDHVARSNPAFMICLLAASCQSAAHRHQGSAPPAVQLLPCGKMRSLATTYLSVFKCAVGLAVIDNSIYNNERRESEVDLVDAAVQSHVLNKLAGHIRMLRPAPTNTNNKRKAR
jgi:hypothetical protein